MPAARVRRGALLVAVDVARRASCGDDNQMMHGSECRVLMEPVVLGLSLRSSFAEKAERAQRSQIESFAYGASALYVCHFAHRCAPGTLRGGYGIAARISILGCRTQVRRASGTRWHSLMDADENNGQLHGTILVGCRGISFD